MLKAYQNKFKLIFFIGLLYIIKKGYNFYKSVKPYLSLINDLRGGNSNSNTAKKAGGPPNLLGGLGGDN